MATTARVGITLLEAAQAQKEITVNEGFARIDALLNGGVIDKDLSVPPTSPASGDLYIVGANPTGLWADKQGNLAYFDAIWRFIVPKTGLLMWVNDENAHYVFNGTTWAQIVLTADMTKSIYDAANISQQVVGTTATQTVSNKVLSSTEIRGNTGIGSFTGTAAIGTFISGANSTTTYSGVDFRTSFTGAAPVGRIAMLAAANGSSIAIGTSNSYASGVTTQVANFGNGLVVGNPTGGDKGFGTINASAVYDDNTLLSCYVGEAYRTGEVSVEYWDGFAPEIDGVRSHEKARGFARVAADRLDTEKFCKFFYDTGRLPSMPGPEHWVEIHDGSLATGDLVQRLWETVEVLTVHIAKLHGRVKTLEKANG